MKKTFKKIVAYVVTFAIFAVIVSGMTVSASTQFAFNLGRGSSDCITMVKQNNNINYATVNITSGNLSNTHIVYIWMENPSSSKITPTITITEAGTYTLNYSTPILLGSSVKFCASGGYYGVQISGTIEV